MPFHDEKSPSFHITPARGMFFCFGCHEGGDVISFVQKIDQLSFTEAVERLADKVGLHLRYEEARAGSAPQAHREQRTRLVEAHRAAALYYAGQLAESPEAVPGAASSTSAASTATQPTGSASDTPACRRHPAQAPAPARLHRRGTGQFGLVAQGRGAPYDRFRGRLVWPIHDLLGDVVGFGARRLYDDDRIEAKYLNTPETAIYKKSHVLYGVEMAKKEIARRSQAVVVEGYTDVMACHPRRCRNSGGHVWHVLR